VIARVITGGQTGADQGALRAARVAGIGTGGVAPRGWLTEDGPAPWLAGWGLVECDRPGYPARTVANVRDSDGTLWFGDWMTPGGKTTLDACRLQRKPFLIVYANVTRPSQVVEWIAGKNVRVLNVAGNRESKAPGIGVRVERFPLVVFRKFRKT
jgi:hypothetical protein